MYSSCNSFPDIDEAFAADKVLKNIVKNVILFWNETIYLQFICQTYLSSDVFKAVKNIVFS